LEAINYQRINKLSVAKIGSKDGNMAFTVPLFDQFMQRAMPNFDAND